MTSILDFIRVQFDLISGAGVWLRNPKRYWREILEEKINQSVTVNYTLLFLYMNVMDKVSTEGSNKYMDPSRGGK